MISPLVWRKDDPARISQCALASAGRGPQHSAGAREREEEGGLVSYFTCLMQLIGLSVLKREHDLDQAKAPTPSRDSVAHHLRNILLRQPMLGVAEQAEDAYTNRRG